MRVICLKAQCTDNQQFSKNSEEAEFFTASCLVFSIFFRKFKIAGWESYKAKTNNALIFDYVGSPASQGKNMRVTCLKAQCTDNQRFSKISEEAEFFAASCLVFSIFFLNFKIAGWESYKAKTYIALIYIYI